MKRLLVFISLVLIIFSLDTKLLGDTFYNYYNEYIKLNNLKIVNNKDYFDEVSFNTKEIYSSKFQITDSTIANNIDELINIYYTVLNKGYKNYTFYCSDTYFDCLSDIESLDSNPYFSLMNQFVNVYNSYDSISSIYSTNLKVNLTVSNRYSLEEQEKINNEIDRIIKELNIGFYTNLYDKIKIFHDYLAEKNVYDTVREETGDSIYHSDTAIGTLFEGYSVCNGYADALSLFFDKLEIPNIKVATDTHVWNAVFINDRWYHIDLTWDDPVTSNNSNIITYDYFMITTDELLKKDLTEHNFNKDIYDFIN